VPMATDSVDSTAIVPEGYPLPKGQSSIGVLDATVDERYFDVMGIPIVAGRAFIDRDRDGTPMVAVVNESLARKYWPDASPLGKRFQLAADPGQPWVEVVGVARESKYIWLAEPPTDFVYLPYRQHPHQRMLLVARSIAADPAPLTAPLREVVRTMDRNQPIFNVRTMSEFYRMRAINIFDVVIGTVAAMGLMGLGLAIVGIYGLMSYAVMRRTREIGIRMAIGADRGSVLRMVLRQGAALAGAGLALGLVGAVGAGRALRAMFPGAVTRPGTDVIGLAIVGVLVLLITMLAAYVPARRASRVDPIKALRYE
jgi:putative ABC transport system permease protein